MAEIINQASREMPEAEFLKMRDDLMRTHQLFADSLKRDHGYSVPGNDPDTPN